MKLFFRVAIGIGVSFAILSLMLHQFTAGVSLENRPSLIAVMQQSLSIVISLYFFVHIVQLIIRAIRYRLLLFISGEQNVPSFQHMFLVTGVRNMCADLLPARLGELSYIAMLNRGYQVSAQACLSSLSVAIAFDFVALLLIIFGIFIAQIVSIGFSGWMFAALLSALILSIIAIGGLFYFIPSLVAYLDQKQNIAWLELKSIKPVWRLAKKLSAALELTRKSGKLFAVMCLSVLIRILKYGGFYLLFIAVTKSMFPSFAELPIHQVFSALIGGELATSLPIPSFMGFGVYEAGSTAVFVALGLDKIAATIIMLSLHIWSQLFDYAIGGLCFLLFIGLIKLATKEKIASKKRAMRYIKQWWQPFLASLILLFGTVILANEIRSSKKLGAISAPPVGHSLVEQNSARLTNTAKELIDVSGFAVWSSNRFGNHDIVHMKLPSREISALTNHPHAEFFPRISPDGKKIVFARSQQEWVSQRNWVAWDVYLLDLVTGEEKKIAENATFPDWVDHNRISYLSNGTQVVVKELGWFGREEVVYESGKNNKIPVNTLISTPDYHPQTKQVVLTAKQSQLGMRSGHWGTALVNHDGSLQPLLNGCQAFFSADGSYLYQITDGGDFDPKGNRLVKIDLASGKESELFDFNDDYSHIYFPKQSQNGQFMIFAGSASGHEHDTADYEIFLWDMSKTASYATRLSFHSGNDNWPDIHINNKPAL